MDLFGKPITDYPEILKTIGTMTFKKSLSIKSLVTHKMQQRNSYTCGWWSLYLLLASNNLHSVLPELFCFNIPEINETFLYNLFKHYAIDWNCQNWFTKLQPITAIEHKCKCCK